MLLECSTHTLKTQLISIRVKVTMTAFENELGVQAPVGFWDPAGLSSDGSVENFKRRRQTELKHGRISMLATMGYITPEITGKFPGYLSPSAGLKFADVPNGLAAISQSASSRLGSDFGLHGLLRSFPGPVCWNSCCSW